MFNEQTSNRFICTVTHSESPCRRLKQTVLLLAHERDERELDFIASLSMSILLRRRWDDCLGRVHDRFRLEVNYLHRHFGSRVSTSRHLLTERRTGK